MNYISNFVESILDCFKSRKPQRKNTNSHNENDRDTPAPYKDKIKEEHSSIKSFSSKESDDKPNETPKTKGNSEMIELEGNIDQGTLLSLPKPKASVGESGNMRISSLIDDTNSLGLFDSKNPPTKSNIESIDSDVTGKTSSLPIAKFSPELKDLVMVQSPEKLCLDSNVSNNPINDSTLNISEPLQGDPGLSTNSSETHKEQLKMLGDKAVLLNEDATFQICSSKTIQNTKEKAHPVNWTQLDPVNSGLTKVDDILSNSDANSILSMPKDQAKTKTQNHCELS